MVSRFSLAERSMSAALLLVGRSLRLRGFVRRDQGFSRQIGQYHQLIWLEVLEGRDPGLVTLSVVLGLDREVPTAGLRPLGTRPAQVGHLEATLWDLIPGRERGGSWAVTVDSALDVVVADVVAALERYGLGYLDDLARDDPPADSSGSFDARGVHRRSAAWRNRRVSQAWLREGREGGPRSDGFAG